MQEEENSSDDNNNEAIEENASKVTRLEKDLSDIKQRNDHLSALSQNLSSEDNKEFQRLLKEKDKLEREALVQRI